MEYLGQILTPHGVALLLLLVISTAAMTRIFSCLHDLRYQINSMEDLIPHLRASISSGNYAKAGVAAESDNSSTGRLIAAIMREPSRNAKRMRLIYKLNIDEELRSRLRYLSPLKRWAVWALLFGVAGAVVGWLIPSTEPFSLKKMIIVSLAGVVVFVYMLIFYFTLRRREIEFNDTLAAEALSLIDTATRKREPEEVISPE